MLDREVVKEFLDDELDDMEIEMPQGIVQDSLVEAFCRYVEDDYYEWLKDNLRSFFDHGNPDWDWIRQRIGQQSRS